MLLFIFTFLPSLNNPYSLNPKYDIKIQLNFYFGTSLWYLKKGFMKTFKTFNLFEVQQRSVKIKIYLKFILVKSLGTLGIARVKFYKRKGKGHWIRESLIYELMGSHSSIIILCSLSCFCLSGVCLLFFRFLVCLFSLQL